MPDAGGAWLSVAEAERRSGRKRRTLRRYAQQGRLQLRYADDGSVEYLASDVATLATPDHPDHPHEQTAASPSVEIVATPGQGDDHGASPAQMAHQVGVLRGQLIEVRADRDQWRDLAHQYLEQARAAERDLAALRGGQVATEQTTPVATPDQAPAAAEVMSLTPSSERHNDAPAPRRPLLARVVDRVFRRRRV